MDAALNQAIPAEICFGDWCFRINESELIRDGDCIRLQPRIAKLLTKFVLHPNQVISREQLIDYIWGQKAVNEDALSRCIAELRAILKDKSANPQFIETIPKKGYRFICPIRESVSKSGQSIKSKPIKGVLVAVAAITLIAILCLVAVKLIAPNDQKISLQAALVSATRISADKDRKYQPQLSNAGDKIAYSVAQDGNFVIKIIDRKGAHQQTIAEPGFHLMSPKFSPADDKLYVARFKGNACDVYSYNLLTKQKQQFVSCAVPEAASLLDLSPDGRYLAYVAPERSIENDSNKAVINSSIWILDIESGSQTQLSVPINPQGFDTSPRFSPDGKALAFIRGSSSIRNIYLMDFEPETFVSHSLQQIPAIALTEDAGYISHVDWLKDNRNLIFDSNKQGDRSLWLLDRHSRKQQALGARDALHPSLDRANQGLVFHEVNYNANIWQTELATGSQSKPLIQSIKYNNFPKYAPDGNSIVFVSNRKGKASVWLYDAVTQSQVEMMSIVDAELINPDWDSAGDNLLISSRSASGYQCYQLNLASRTYEAVANINQQYFGCIYDGQGAIYAISREPNQPSYIIKIDQQHTVSKVSDFSVNQIAVVANQQLIYSRPDSKGLYRLNLTNDASEVLVPDYPSSWSAHWTVRDNQLYFARFKSVEALNYEPGVYRMDLATLEQQKVTDELPSAIGNTLDVHPNQHSILLAKTDSVLMNLYYADLGQSQ